MNCRAQTAAAVAVCVVMFNAPSRVDGQPIDARLGFMAVGVVKSANPALFGERITEGYLTQPNLMGEAAKGPLRFQGVLNLEGYTLKRGELNAGIYGEGYIDRRHPHTLVHEAMLSLTSPAAAVGAGAFRASIAAGKGFTAYGTDDPMMRPFVSYPVNHHHAQIIERVQVIGALRYGIGDGRSIAAEIGIFNGDEPLGPFKGPNLDRFGDSHSARVTVLSGDGFEIQGSHAFVKSPGFVRGGAFDHRQTSVSARYMLHGMTGLTGMTGMTGMRDGSDAGSNGLQYLMLEVARTDEGYDAGRAFRYESALAEGSYKAGRFGTVSLRLEQTERPENERLLNPFRTQLGHIDFQIIGITRWRVATVNVAAPPQAIKWLGALGERAGVRLVPFVEVARSSAEARRKPAVFIPREFYGSATQWSISLGIRMHLGDMRARMGRYGVMSTLPGAAREGMNH